MNLRKSVVRISPDSLRVTVRLYRMLLGRRAYRLLLQPVLGVGLAVCETVVLLSIVRLLLMLVDGTERTSLDLVGLELAFGFEKLAAVAFAATTLALLFRLAEASLTGKYVALAVRNARRTLVRSWFTADWEHARSLRAGRLQQLLGVNSQQASTPVNLLAVGSTAAFSLLIYTTIIVLTAPFVAGILVLLGVGSAVAFTPLRKRVRRHAQLHVGGLREIQLSATTYSSLNRELHVFGVEDAAVNGMDQQIDLVAEHYRRLRFLQRVTPGLFQQVMLAAVIGLVVAGHALDVSAVGFGTAAILGVRSLSYVQQLNTQLQSFAESAPFLEELLENITEQQRNQVSRGSLTLERVVSCELRKVSHEYEPGTPALSDVDLTIQSGEWVAIVGPSGSGKTTLCNVIAGLHLPTSGRYLVNGEESVAFTAESWSSQFGLLSQEPTLLRASVSENIAFHRDFDSTQIRDAAESAAIADAIDAMPQGMNSMVGDGYSSLSGGQRQRLALARTLVGAPSCIILDEPTSALDAANEAILEESLARAASDAIVIVVSHREALLNRCGRFLTIEAGRIVSDVGRDPSAAAGPRERS